MLPELLDYSDLFNSKVTTSFSLKHSAMVTNLDEGRRVCWVRARFRFRFRSFSTSSHCRGDRPASHTSHFLWPLSSPSGGCEYRVPTFRRSVPDAHVLRASDGRWGWRLSPALSVGRVEQRALVQSLCDGPRAWRTGARGARVRAWREIGAGPRRASRASAASKRAARSVLGF